jgi:hypothetical protein
MRVSHCYLWRLGRFVGLEGLSMNFIERFQSLWQLPSPKELAQSGMEYAKRMSDYHADRIKRLTNYLENAE